MSGADPDGHSHARECVDHVVSLIDRGSDVDGTGLTGISLSQDKRESFNGVNLHHMGDTTSMGLQRWAKRGVSVEISLN